MSLVHLAGPVTATSASATEPAVISVGTLDLDGAITFTVNPGASGADTDLRIDSAIRDGTANGAIVKDGAGRMTVTSADSGFTGATTIDAGTLLDNGDLGVVALAGGTLAGNGGVGNITRISGGGGIEPGTTPAGVFTPDHLIATDPVAIGDNTYTVLLGGTNPGAGAGGYNQLLAFDTVDLDHATLALETFGGFAPLVDDEFDIITSTNGFDNDFSNHDPSAANSFTLDGMHFLSSIDTSSGTPTYVLKRVKAETTTTLLTPTPSSPVATDSVVTFTAKVTLQAGASGSPTGVVTFFSDGNSLGTGTLNGSNIATYTTTAGQLPAGLHSVSAEYDVAGLDMDFSSSNATSQTFTVGSAPVVGTQPQSQTVGVNQTVTFTAAASGDPNPTVRWQVSTDNGMTFSDVGGATSPTLSFVALASENGNQYRAVFTNADGTATTQNATLLLNSTRPTTTVAAPSQSFASASASVSFVVTYSDTNFNASTLASGDVIQNATGSAHAGAISVVGSGNIRTVTLSNITGDGSLGIVIPAGTATDTFGNPSTASPASATFTVDNTPPTASVGAPSQAFANSTASVSFLVTYTDANFNSSTLSTAGITQNATGTAHAATLNITGTGTTRTVTLSNITGDGTLGITVAAAAATDLAGNASTASSPSSTFSVDNTAPTVSVGIPSQNFASASASVSFVVTYTDINFNASTLAAGGVLLIPTGTANASTINVSGLGNTRTVTLSNFTGDGSLAISIKAGTATDLAGNLATASSATSTFTVDTTPPAVAIGAPSQMNANAAASVSFVVTYTDANFNASTLVPANVTVNATGSAAAGSVNVTGTGATRSVTLSNLSGTGTLGISLPAGTANDLAGNPAVAAGPSVTFHVDTTAPTATALTASQSLLTSASAGHVFTLKVSFSEAMNTSVNPSIFFPSGYPRGVLLVKSGVWLNSTTFQASYTVTDSKTNYNQIMAQVTGARDLAGNLQNIGMFSKPFSVNQQHPALKSIVSLSGTSTTAATVTFRVSFDLAVTGVDLADFRLAISGLTGAKFTGFTKVSGSVYNVTITTGKGTGTLQLNLVNNGTIKSTVGNGLGSPALGETAVGPSVHVSR